MSCRCGRHNNDTENAPLAQLVEHLTLNQGVQGASPWRCTRENRFWRHRSSGDCLTAEMKCTGSVKNC